MYSAWCKRRSVKEMSDSSGHSNERYLNTPEKKAKMKNLKDRSRAAEKQVRTLKLEHSRRKSSKQLKLKEIWSKKISVPIC